MIEKKHPRSRQKTNLFIRDFRYIPKTPNQFHPHNFPKSIKIPIFTIIFSASTQYLRSNNQNRLKITCETYKNFVDGRL